MVAEQDVGEELELEAPPDGCEPLEEVVPVFVAQEQEAIVAAMGAHVVDALNERARTAWHPASVGAATGHTLAADKAVTHLAHFSLDRNRCPTPISTPISR